MFLSPKGSLYQLLDPGPETPPEKRNWTLPRVYRTMRGWLFPYVRSRVTAGDFHPITSYGARSFED